STCHSRSFLLRPIINVTSKRLFEVADLFLRFVPGDSITLLQAAGEIFAAAVGTLQIVVGELAPLLLELSGKLFPLTFDSVLVHDCSRLIEKKCGLGSTRSIARGQGRRIDVPHALDRLGNGY